MDLSTASSLFSLVPPSPPGTSDRREQALIGKWSSGLFDCLSDKISCLGVMCCMPIVFGQVCRRTSCRAPPTALVTPPPPSRRMAVVRGDVEILGSNSRTLLETAGFPIP